jgi:hypothetical protein
MSDQYTRGDSVREYQTGVNADGNAQSDVNLSLGNYRSSTLAASLGFVIEDAIPNLTIDFASGANPVGSGLLIAPDDNTLTWKPFGSASAGPSVVIGTSETKIIEALNNPGAFLRVTALGPFSPTSSNVILSYLINNYFGFSDISVSDATAGVIEYRASIIRNESSSVVSAYQRYIATLGTARASDAGNLAGSGSGTITTTGSLADWPVSGWCQVRNSGGTLKEVVYYSSRTATVLTVPASGRGLLGTSATAGSATDGIFPVPGIAIGIDPTGSAVFGSSIQSVPNRLTAPTGITWNLGVTPAGGLQIGTLAVGRQVGIWMKRHIPAGAISTPFALNRVWDVYNAY